MNILFISTLYPAQPPGAKENIMYRKFYKPIIPIFQHSIIPIVSEAN
jgi:hypothetical protein